MTSLPHTALWAIIVLVFVTGASTNEANAPLSNAEDPSVAAKRPKPEPAGDDAAIRALGALVQGGRSSGRFLQSKLCEQCDALVLRVTKLCKTCRICVFCKRALKQFIARCDHCDRPNGKPMWKSPLDTVNQFVHDHKIKLNETGDLSVELKERSSARRTSNSECSCKNSLLDSSVEKRIINSSGGKTDAGTADVALENSKPDDEDADMINDMMSRLKKTPADRKSAVGVKENIEDILSKLNGDLSEDQEELEYVLSRIKDIDSDETENVSHINLRWHDKKNVTETRTGGSDETDDRRTDDDELDEDSENTDDLSAQSESFEEVLSKLEKKIKTDTETNDSTELIRIMPVEETSDHNATDTDKLTVSGLLSRLKDDILGMGSAKGGRSLDEILSGLKQDLRTKTRLVQDSHECSDSVESADEGPAPVDDEAAARLLLETFSLSDIREYLERCKGKLCDGERDRQTLDVIESLLDEIEMAADGRSGSDSRNVTAAVVMAYAADSDRLSGVRRDRARRLLATCDKPDAGRSSGRSDTPDKGDTPDDYLIRTLHKKYIAADLAHYIETDMKGINTEEKFMQLFNHYLNIQSASHIETTRLDTEMIHRVFSELLKGFSVKINLLHTKIVQELKKASQANDSMTKEVLESMRRTKVMTMMLAFLLAQARPDVKHLEATTVTLQKELAKLSLSVASAQEYYEAMPGVHVSGYLKEARRSARQSEGLVQLLKANEDNTLDLNRDLNELAVRSSLKTVLDDVKSELSDSDKDLGNVLDMIQKRLGTGRRFVKAQTKAAVRKVLLLIFRKLKSHLVDAAKETAKKKVKKEIEKCKSITEMFIRALEVHDEPSTPELSHRLKAIGELAIDRQITNVFMHSMEESNVSVTVRQDRKQRKIKRTKHN